MLSAQAQSACPSHTVVSPSPTSRTFNGVHGDWQWSVEIPSNYRAMALNGGSKIYILSPSEYELAKCLIAENPGQLLLGTGFFRMATISLDSQSARQVSYTIGSADEFRANNDGIPFVVETLSSDSSDPTVISHFFLGYVPEQPLRTIVMIGKANNVYVQEMINSIRVSQDD